MKAKREEYRIQNIDKTKFRVYDLREAVAKLRGSEITTHQALMDTLLGGTDLRMSIGYSNELENADTYKTINRRI